MQLSECNGIRFGRGKDEFYIDAGGIKNKTAIITHAHSDHAKPTKSNSYFATKETKALIYRNQSYSIKEMRMGKKFRLNGSEVSFHSSGHILGSAQVKIENDSTTVITSDLKTQRSILFEGADQLNADTLLIETTFGLPEYNFPPREIVYEDMMAWLHSCTSKNTFVVLGGYSTGKAQELTKVVNEFAGATPLVHPRIYEQNKVYEKNGVKLGNYYKLDHNLNDSDVLIMPPHYINDDLLHALEHQLQRKVECAIATGWKGLRYKTFPLSDHADFNGLIKYVKNANPKTVLTHHGFAQEFANYVQRRLRIPARPLGEAAQTLLREYNQ